MNRLYLFILLLSTLFLYTACEKDYSYEGGTVAPVSTAAVFTFVGAPNTCTAAIPTGTYIIGMATGNSNTVSLSVNVTTAGSYSLTTPVVNGVSFSGTGNLTVGTAQTIILAANGGIATASGSFIYPITNGVSNCSFNVVYNTLPPATPDSIVAMVDSVYTTFNITDTARLDNTSLPGYAGIHINGKNGAGSERFTMNIARFGNALAAGTYTINNFPQSINSTFYASTNGNFSAASNLTIGNIQNFGFFIIITEITNTKVTGIFFGRLRANGVGPEYKTVTDGSFSVTIYP